MVLSYDYAKRKRRRQRTNAPPSRVISIAMAVRQWNTERITQWRRSRAFIKATKLCHRVTTCSILPRRPPGTQSTQRWATCPPPLLAISMAVVMRQYDTAHIARWRRFVAFIKATKRHHRTSTHSDSVNRSSQCCHFRDISSSNRWKRARVALITIGVWHINLTGRTWRMEWNT